MASFLAKVKEHLEATQVDASHSPEQLRLDFARKVSESIKSYLAVMAKSLKEIDREITASLKLVAADAFSKKREAAIREQIQHWINSDDVFRRDVFTKAVRAFSKKLNEEMIVQIFEAEFDKWEPKISKHVDLARKYGEKWTEQLDNAGLAIQDSVIKKTIQNFSQLTVEELRSDYRRDIRTIFKAKTKT